MEFVYETQNPAICFLCSNMHYNKTKVKFRKSYLVIDVRMDSFVKKLLSSEKIRIYKDYIIKGKSGLQHRFDILIKDSKTYGVIVTDFLDVTLYVKAVITYVDTQIPIIIVADKIDPDIRQYTNGKNDIIVIEMNKIKKTILFKEINKVMK